MFMCHLRAVEQSPAWWSVNEGSPHHRTKPHLSGALLESFRPMSPGLVLAPCCSNKKLVSLDTIISETWLVQEQVREPHVNPPIRMRILPLALVLKGNLCFPNALFSREGGNQRRSARICENLRLGSLFPLRFVPLSTP